MYGEALGRPVGFGPPQAGGCGPGTACRLPAVVAGVGGLGLHGCESGLHPDTFPARRQALLRFRAAALAHLGLAPPAPPHPPLGEPLGEPLGKLLEPAQRRSAPAAAVGLAQAALAREAALERPHWPNATAAHAAALLRAAADALRAAPPSNSGLSPLEPSPVKVRVLVVQRSDRRRFRDVNRLASAVRDASTPKLQLAVKVSAHAATRERG